LGAASGKDARTGFTAEPAPGKSAVDEGKGFITGEEPFAYHPKMGRYANLHNHSLGNIGMSHAATDNMRIPIPEDGVHRTAFPDGKPEEEYTIKHGKRHGIYRRWHPTGVLAEESRYRNGLLHGVMRQWTLQGRLLGSSTFQNGTGLLRNWYDNGQLSSELSYFQGEWNGRMRFWAEDGMLYGQKYYFNGRPIPKKGYLAKCGTIPGLPRFQDDKTAHTLGNYVRRLRRAKREQAKLGPTPEQLDEERWFDEECKAEAEHRASKELVSWLGRGAKQHKELGEMSKSEALRLVRKLYGLGAIRVWATNIERDEDGAQYSRSLIVALPNDSEKRTKLYELCADPARPSSDGSAPAIRVGKNFMSVSLM
jgi:hypothetical protein